MISLQTLQTQLSKCQSNNKFNLPNQKKSFVQNTAYDFKLKMLRHNQKMNEIINEIPSFTMEKEMNKLKNNIDDVENKDEDKTLPNYIPNDSLILITENSSLDLPKTLIDIIKETNIKQDEFYLYGVKNPDSFYKSLLLLIKNNYIIGNKNRKRNEVLTFKKEIVIKFEMFFKELKYKQYKIVKSTFLNNALNVDNYVNYDICLYLADYLQTNLLLIDVVNFQYIATQYEYSELNKDFDNNNSEYTISHNKDEYLVIIKYDNDTFLPLMNFNGNHYISKNVVETLRDKKFNLMYDTFSQRGVNISIKMTSTKMNVKNTNTNTTTMDITNVFNITSEDLNQAELIEEMEPVESNNDTDDTTRDKTNGTSIKLEKGEGESEIDKLISDLQTHNKSDFNNILDLNDGAFVTQFKYCQIPTIKQYAKVLNINNFKTGKTKNLIARTKKEILLEIKSVCNNYIKNKNN